MNRDNPCQRRKSKKNWSEVSEGDENEVENEKRIKIERERNANTYAREATDAVDCGLK